MSETYPDDLRYNKEHDWARLSEDEATLGITWHAQEALGEVVHFEPPQVGSEIASGGSYGEIESVKAVSDLISPLSGEILEVNGSVVDAPELINATPYESGWLVRIRMSDPDEVDALLDAKTYEAWVADQ
jgi:glycine cleavage system H protein